MVEWLRAHTVLEDHLGLVPRIPFGQLTTTCNSRFRASDTSSGFHRRYMYIYAVSAGVYTQYL